MTHNSKVAIEQALKARDVSRNHICEFGVYSGNSVRFIRQNTPSSVSVFGFDSFEGLPVDWNLEDKEILKKGHFSMKGAIPDIPNVKFYKGWFEDTLPEYLKIAEPLSFIHLDADLYESAVTVLFGLNEHILPGTVILFDDWMCQGMSNDQRACDHWCKEKGREYRCIENKWKKSNQRITVITK